MIKETKIVLVGGGSTQFAPLLLSDFLTEPALDHATVVLLDKHEKKLQRVFKLGKRLCDASDSGMVLECTSDRAEALPGADFLIISVEQDRFPTWEMDRAIPKRYGIHQALGENGGPGGLLHSLRQIPPIVEILLDAQELCPGALVMNLSNPMSRIMQAIVDYTDVRALGLCHEIAGGTDFVCELLGEQENNLDLLAAGLNHFSWFLKVQDKTGRDLYPQLLKRLKEKPHKDRLLVADLARLIGYVSITGDSHVGEYLRDGHLWSSKWAEHIEPLDFFQFYRDEIRKLDNRVDDLGSGRLDPHEFLSHPSGEIVADVITAVLEHRETRFAAVNVPNDGLVNNLPPGCIVEVPAKICGQEISPIPVVKLPDILAAWCMPQTVIHSLTAKAAMDGDRAKALQVLLLDPVVPDRVTAERCLDDMLLANRDYLPRFFS